ncbi:P-loop NTPase fold protein [Agrobacterium vitis]
MSVSNVKTVIKRFLSSKEPEVLCVRGRWGTGKTHTWKSIVTELRNDSQSIALNEYAYVSLFGINSIAELKTQILQSTVVRSQIGEPPDLSTFEKFLQSAESGVKKGLIKTVVGALGSRGEALVSTMHFLIHRTIICIDDIERKGKNLSEEDILGLVNFFKTERDCKIVLLVNEESLPDRQKFEKHLEKVVDISLKFDPSPLEIAYIAIPQENNDTFAVMVRESAEKLRITNVRVIRKILNLAQTIRPLLEKYSSSVSTHALKSLTLLGWSHLEPDYAPPLAFLERSNGPKQENTEGNLEWRDLLLSYGWVGFDRFDSLLLEGIKRGYFLQQEIDEQASYLHKLGERDLILKDLQRLNRDVLYLFKKPVEEILDEIWAVYTGSVSLISLYHMSEIEKTFRKFSDPRCDEIIAIYIKQNAGISENLRMSELFLYEDEPSEQLVKAIEQAANEKQSELRPKEIFVSLRNSFPSTDILAQAAALPLEEYVNAIRTFDTTELSDLFSGFRRFLSSSVDVDLTEAMITKAATALQVIERDGGSNAIRARQPGFIQWLEQKEAASAARDISE